MTLRQGSRLQKWLLEPRSSGLMTDTGEGGWRALIRTPLMQWRSQQASFRVNAHLKKKKKKNDASLSPSILSLSFILSFAPSVANLSEPHPLIRAHLRIGHCASGWLGWLDRWWRPGRRLTDWLDWLYKLTADNTVGWSLFALWRAATQTASGGGNICPFLIQITLTIKTLCHLFYPKKLI